MSEENILMRPCRRFLGGLRDFESTMQRNYQKAHLKAYLKGKKVFPWGWIQDDEKKTISRGWHMVAQDLTPIPMENPESRASKRRLKKMNLV